MSQLVKTEGFVLRAIPFQDEDLILTVLTSDLGKVTVFAKSARRPRSRFGRLPTPFGRGVRRAGFAHQVWRCALSSRCSAPPWR